MDPDGFEAESVRRMCLEVLMKAMKWLLVASFLIPVIAVGQELVLEYKFTNDRSRFVADTSGNDLHGNLLGSSVNYFGVGFSRKGLKLNGLDDHLLVPDDAIFDFDQFTLLAWVRFKRNAWDREEILEKAGAFWVNIRQDTRKVRAGGRFGGCAEKPYTLAFDSDEPVPLDTWTHVAVSYDGVTLTTYINGSFSGAAQVPVPGPVCVNIEPLSIGSKHRTIPPTYDGAYFKGLMDTVRIFDAALSPEMIREQMFTN
jgi:hypothetical protein